MRTVLKNIVQFTGLSIGVPVSLPHSLIVNDIAIAPQLGGMNAPGFTATADATNVTVTRTAAATSGAVNVYVEHWHTIEAILPVPGQLAGLTPFFFTGGATSAPVPPTPSGPQPVSYFDDIISAANWGFSLANNSGFATIDWNPTTQQAMCGTVIMNAYQVGVPDEAQIFYNAKQQFTSVFPSPFFKFSEGTFTNTWRVKIASAPPTALEDYLAAVGVNDGMPGFFPNLAGVWFEISFANGNVNWWAVSQVGGVPIKVDTGVPMVSGNAFNLAVVCEYGVSAKFYIGGVLVATIAMNLPGDQNLFPNIYLKPTAGINTVTLIADYTGFDWNVIRT